MTAKLQGTGLIIAKEIILLFWKVSECSESFYEKLGNFSIIAQPKQIDVSRKSVWQRALGKGILREGPGHYLRKARSQRGGWATFCLQVSCDTHISAMKEGMKYRFSVSYRI